MIIPPQRVHVHKKSVPKHDTRYGDTCNFCVLNCWLKNICWHEPGCVGQLHSCFLLLSLLWLCFLGFLLSTFFLYVCKKLCWRLLQSQLGTDKACIGRTARQLGPGCVNMGLNNKVLQNVHGVSPNSKSVGKIERLRHQCPCLFANAPGN